MPRMHKWKTRIEEGGNATNARMEDELKKEEMQRLHQWKTNKFYNSITFRR